MTSIMRSINPKWCTLISKGEKTVEVRKRILKRPPPYKVYIYATKSKNPFWIFTRIPLDKTCGTTSICTSGGVIIGEYICDKIIDIRPHDDGFGVDQYVFDAPYGECETCLTFEELNGYLKGKRGFGEHISDLVIYDKPKELLEFKSRQFLWRGNNHIHKFEPMKLPPQSWCYVEEKDGDKK